VQVLCKQKSIVYLKYTSTCVLVVTAQVQREILKKKGPAINDMTRSELEMELFNLQSDGFQSSGASNEIMEHNQRRIEDRGLEYHPEDMAIYIYFNFNPDAKK